MSEKVMASQPLVSVVVPVYNVEKMLSRCVDSLVAQTYEHTEIILVDDGSPDQCPRLCDEWAQRDSRIHVVHQHNQGLAAARNAGMDHARGAYYAFVDSDDYVEPTYVERMVEAARRYSADLVICGYVAEDASLHPKPKDSLVTEVTLLDHRQGLSGITQYMEVELAWNKLYRSRIWEDYRYPAGKLHEDEYAVHHVMDHCERTVLLPDQLYHYVDNGASIMHTAFSARNLDAAEALLDRARFFASNGLGSYVQTTCRSVIRRFMDAGSLLSDGNVRGRVRELSKSMRRDRRLIMSYLGTADRLKWWAFMHAPLMYIRLKRMSHRQS